jgi:hypothetical protein
MRDDLGWCDSGLGGEEELSLLLIEKHDDAGDTNTTYAWRMMALWARSPTASALRVASIAAGDGE